MSRFINKNIFPLSINSYGLLFIVLTLLSFGSVALYSIYQIDDIKTSAKNKTRLLAQKEVSGLIKKIKNELEKTANSFSHWEELRQQLDNPVYYAYWHKSRMPNASFIPEYFKTVELYDASGLPLSSNPVSIRQLTKRLRDENIYINPDKNSILQITHIKNDDQQLKGFLIVEYNFNGILDSINLKYINKETLSFNDVKLTIPLQKLTNHISYQVTHDDAFDELQNVIFKSIISLSIIGALISLTLWIVIAVFSGKPLKVLAAHIDSIKYGQYKKLHKAINPLLITREYETVRESFNRFQHLLKESESALIFSESRLQTVLENISIGIITFDEDMIIDSCNAEILNVFAYKHDELIGTSINRLFDDDGQQVFHYLFEKLQNIPAVAEIEPTDITGIQKDTGTVELNLHINQVQFAGKQIFIAMIRDISREKRANEKLEQMANYDALTTLPNRTLFHDRLIHAIDQAKRKKSLVGLMFLDLDRFKFINDSLGHHIGDLLLIQAAKRIRECIREGDTVARLGGDEFTIINEYIQSTEESISVASRINEAMRMPFVIEGQEHFISTSIGITFYPQDASTADELIKHADAAMYKAKDRGGDDYQLFTSEISDKTQQRMKIENQLRHAIVNQEFELFYQPRINLTTNEITSFEALMRWNDIDKHRASPAEFIPILEDTGMIINTGNWVLNEACIQLNHWQQSDFSANRIAINLSGRQFKHKHFIEDIDSILHTHGIEPKQIEFEITESLLIDNVEETQEILASLHQRGFHISIDDFGTGYSSLSYLKQFPIDTIKIDQFFLRNYPNDKSDIAIIESIIAIAKNLNMSITAEGIENNQQLQFLSECGCHEAQGYYFSKPMAASIVQTWAKQFKQTNHTNLLTDY